MNDFELTVPDLHQYPMKRTKILLKIKKTLHDHKLAMLAFK